jgi:hypothetical protein
MKATTAAAAPPETSIVRPREKRRSREFDTYARRTSTVSPAQGLRLPLMPKMSDTEST